MSELIGNENADTNFRRQLLAGVSSAALVLAIVAPGTVLADEETEKATVWIELGGQLESVSGGKDPFSPSFLDNLPNTFFSPYRAQEPPKYSLGVEGALTFEPHGLDWTFTASVRYGRSESTKREHQQTPNAKVAVHSNIRFPPPLSSKYEVRTGYSFYPSGHVKLEDVKAQQSQSHLVMDFRAGKDVGLGLFGSHASTVFSAGIRFAQFSSKTNISLQAAPDVHYPSAPISSFDALKQFNKYDSVHFHNYAALLAAQRSFRGVGPSIAWNGSVPFLGSSERGEVTFDWGGNAAVLFGRQTARGHHQTTSRNYHGTGFKPAAVSLGQQTHDGTFVLSAVYHPFYETDSSGAFNRTRSVIIPNVGGVAGLSVRYPNAKISVGYRADFFFGAMDTGIDTADRTNVGFHGPFATISVGLGG